jgi:hypothetical protein
MHGPGFPTQARRNATIASLLHLDTHGYPLMQPIPNERTLPRTKPHQEAHGAGTCQPQQSLYQVPYITRSTTTPTYTDTAPCTVLSVQTLTYWSYSRLQSDRHSAQRAQLSPTLTPPSCCGSSHLSSTFFPIPALNHCLTIA